MINVWLESLHCHEETDEVGADEPYVLVTAVDLTSSISVAGFPVPLRGIVKGIVGSSVLGSLSLPRPEKVAALKRDMESAGGTPTGAPNFDDIVGTAELTFSNDELRRAQAGEAVSTSLHINGDGGRYELVFRAQASESPLVAFNAVDRFALTIGNRILVTTESGAVFGHDLSGNTIGNGFRF